MTTITQDHIEADRYTFDFRYCTYEKGYAQIDTAQDAWYYGNWCNPVERKIVSYCEGDVTVTECSDDAEFVAEIRRMSEWNKETQDKDIRIDMGLSEEMKTRFVKLGLEDLIH